MPLGMKVGDVPCGLRDSFPNKPLKRILSIIFSSKFSNIEVRKVRLVDYKLFQVADLVCTLEYIHSKIEIGVFSNTEKEFFSKAHDFKKDYWRKIEKQRLQ